jgi:hypothetical protein
MRMTARLLRIARRWGLPWATPAVHRGITIQCELHTATTPSGPDPRHA